MRKERAVAIAAFLVASTLIYMAFVGQDSIEAFRKSRRIGGVITLRHRPSHGSALLTQASPRPLSTVTTVLHPAKDESPSKFPPDSVCGLYQTSDSRGP